MGGVCSYWTVVVPTKSPAEAMAEQWLFVLPMGNNFFARLDCIRFHRMCLCLACCLVQFCSGSIYSFTLVSDDLDVFFSGAKSKQCMQALLLGYICLGATAALSGPFLERKGPRVGMAIGTIMVGLGHILAQAGVSRKDLHWLIVAYGVAVGIGFGLLLITSLSTVQKWFPDLRGSITGLSVVSFGVGNAVFIKVFAVYVAHNEIHKLFWVTGMTFVNYPAVQSQLEGTDGHYFQQVKALSLLQCIFSTDFVCMYVAFAASIMPIVVFIPQAQSLQDLFHVDNMTFMFYTYLWYANPAFARKMVFVALLALECVALVALPQFNVDLLTRQWLSNALTFASGGGLALMPCFVTDMFGVYNSGSMYGLIWTSWSLGAAIAWHFLPGTTLTIDSYEVQLHWMLVLAATALGLMLFVRTNSSDRFFCGYQLTACNKVLVQVPFGRQHATYEDVLDSMSFTTHTPRSVDANADGFVLWSGEGYGAKHIRHV
ncbi:hypothetical protein DYB37_011828 [Aphanomyces astaci]|uniref:Major facilitator superfamily (MFS) profile domain-containing protein n=1 Tax=Aphanomyces astaci TaxID=112090 RepID=A0A418DLC6_APHAT|nr:hypothetical protein DYB35_011635 [Aphanomyces astaci]RHZ30476.1 hypothetical protein DYB37_011828 [Aphanomyces astaci]